MTDPRQLVAFIESARWFGGKGRAWTLRDVRRLGELPGAAPGQRVVVDLVEVGYDALDPAHPDATEHYQLPLSCYREPQEHLAHALVGEWTDPDLGPVHVYDAVHDRHAMQLWLLAFAGSESPGAPDAGPTAPGLAFHRLPSHEPDLAVHSTLFTGEQSNSSVAFGQDSLLKVFRKVSPGPNPDITVHRALTGAGSDHVAQLYGWLDHRFPDAPDGDQWQVRQLAMLQQFLRTASDGWDLALASVRDLFAEADLHAGEVGGDFAGEAARLGTALAETHATLTDTFPTRVLEGPEVDGLAGAMLRRLDEAIDAVPAIAGHATRLRAVFEALTDLSEVRVQTVHGDLHLGQTLRTARGWKVVDFEGEPAKPLVARLEPDSPWRDVAGMLRSFDYAPQVVARAGPPGSDHESQQEADQLGYRAVEWSRRNQHAFLHAYTGRDLTVDEQTLLAAYVADKAVYEAVYETRNRPTWVDIPLQALARLEVPR